MRRTTFRAAGLRSTTLRTAGLSAALLLVSAAAGLGQASAATSGSSGSSSDAHAGTRASAAAPALVDALQRDLHLTKAQATDRLAAETSARTVEKAARKAAGSSYGGSWFDAARGTLVVGLADDSHRAAVEATGARVTRVAHTERTLDATMTKLNAMDAPGGVAGWHVDPKSSTVTVTVVDAHKSDNDVAKFLSRAREAGPVNVEKTSHQPRTLAAGTVGGDPYYTGNVRCSIGFSVQGGFITAGHCGTPGMSVSGWDGSYIGNFQGSSFPDNDYAWVNVGSGWWTVPVVLGWGTVSDQLVRGSGEAPVGASICRSGSTSHWHCGTVLAKNETVNYSQGAVHQMTKTNACAEPGDSGGSFISGDQAQGTTSGGWGNCGSGGETWFQPINEVLNRYGLRLHTA
ncbi:S1 family peptidase [Streptomyces jietaisiensis]|uniref:S1 family peptidase n=1 Tax=Streptomyces griseoaurantiacus TaxID=68213 RepID=A0ABZ1V0H0_9ACTN|nr:S1 family peptidase [Streptomyces jietaisiensis]WTI29771.1 S1 family peptidase [Streptomyces jietaisiensis]